MVDVLSDQIETKTRTLTVQQINRGAAIGSAIDQHCDGGSDFEAVVAVEVIEELSGGGYLVEITYEMGK
jgi:hypothetical protein